MSMTSVPEPPSDEQCFESIIAGIKAAPPGVKVFLNAGEFYGTFQNINANLDLLNRFFTKYPEYAERTFLSVKGTATVSEHGFAWDSSPAGLGRSINNIIEKLGPNKKLDLFEPARVDPKVPIEETMAVLNEYVKSGKIGSIGLSECSAATLERASKVGKVAAVEIEVSFWSYEEETRKVILKAAEIGAVVAAYSPLGQGVLTGNLNPAQLHKDDYRKHYPRFQEEAFENNMKLVDALKIIAEKKSITPAQLCLAWVSSLGPHVVPIPSSTRGARTLENVSAASIELSEQDLEEIKGAIEAHPVSGDRYGKEIMKTVWG
ncbi:pyridoxine 4-dehydrogenase [Rhizoctonia solani]|uniref:Pyridoxine 4-dehydrogenase n=1 Tax=Rhizoctonia solani TaxID=456999 RepID=A0A0K6GER0_9AGAM|nr:pyridoxine 4-dehydrogenase [Rhizoctonia solani]